MWIGLGIGLDRIIRFGVSVYFKIRFSVFTDRSVFKEINDRDFGLLIIRFGRRLLPKRPDILARRKESEVKSWQENRNKRT